MLDYRPPADTVRALIDQFAVSQPHAVFARFPETGEQITYAELHRQSRQQQCYLAALGLRKGDTVSVMVDNGAAALALFIGVLYGGYRVSPLNPAAGQDQIEYVLGHSDSAVVFVCPAHIDQVHQAVKALPRTIRMITTHQDRGPAWPLKPDFQAPIQPLSAQDDGLLMYTSGTTGNPKGVVYSHRSMVLHTFGAMMADTIGVSERDVVLPVVPMFHANAWGFAHAAVATGATIVMPGADLSAPSLADIIETEKVTVAAGVPTIWMGVLPELEGRDVSALRAIPCGGSAVPKALSEGFREATGLPILQAWGMTETSPLAAVCSIKSTLDHLSIDEKADLRTSIGLISPGVDFRIADDETDEEQPWDGESRGELQVRGPWVAKEYYNDERANESFTDDGWLKTGDVATCDSEGYIRLVDRTKDLIKSGGEWISSVELENEIMAHPDVVEAAVIGVTSTKWGERAMACVVVTEGASLTSEDILEWLDGRIAKWWMPDRVEFIEEVPKTSVGKFSKKTLRSQFADVVVD